jgi:hypothetical protein
MSYINPDLDPADLELTIAEDDLVALVSSGAMDFETAMRIAGFEIVDVDTVVE